MAHTIPTVADLVRRFPAFAVVPVSTVEMYIADAAAMAVDTSWGEANYAVAIAAKAAHEMALFGLGEQSETESYAAAGLTSIKSGNFQASFSADTVKKASAGGLDATRYGQLYKRLLRAEKAGPRVVAQANYAGPPPRDGFLT